MSLSIEQSKLYITSLMNDINHSLEIGSDLLNTLDLRIRDTIKEVLTLDITTSHIQENDLKGLEHIFKNIKEIEQYGDPDSTIPERYLKALNIVKTLLIAYQLSFLVNLDSNKFELSVASSDD